MLEPGSAVKASVESQCWSDSDALVDIPPDWWLVTGAETTGRNSAEQTESSLSWEMDNRRVKELFAQDEEDSIPLADDDPLDVIDESFISEEKKICSTKNEF